MRGRWSVYVPATCSFAGRPGATTLAVVLAGIVKVHFHPPAPSYSNLLEIVP